MQQAVTLRTNIERSIAGVEGLIWNATYAPRWERATDSRALGAKVTTTAIEISWPVEVTVLNGASGLENKNTRQDGGPERPHTPSYYAHHKPPRARYLVAA